MLALTTRTDIGFIRGGREALTLALARVRAYLRWMSWFPRPVGPREALRDLAAFLRQRSREQVIGASLALLVTAVIVIEFLVDSKIGTAPPAQIVYAQSWSANRTDAEIIAEQKKDQAERHAAQVRKKQQFEKLANELGMD